MSSDNEESATKLRKTCRRNVSKKTRNSIASERKFKMKWTVGMQVWCKVNDNMKKQEESGWVIGEIVKVNTHVLDSSCNAYVFVRLEASGSLITIVDNEFQKRLRQVDPITEFLRNDGSKRFIYSIFKKSLKESQRKELVDEFLATDDKGDYDYVNAALEKLESNKDKQGVMGSLKEILLGDENARGIIELATGKAGQEDNPLVALGFLVGRIIGIEVQYEMLTNGKDDNDASSIIDTMSKASSEGGDKQFRSFDCEVAKVMLFAAMTTCIKKRHTLDPTAGIFDHRSEASILENGGRNCAFNKKADRTKTILTCLHAAQTDSTNGLGRYKLVRSLLLFLDKKGGVSDQLMDILADAGLTVTTKTLRDKVMHLSQSINPNDIRKSPPQNKVPIHCFLFDNADFHIYASVLSMIVAGTILVGYEDTGDDDLMNRDYINKLPFPEAKDLNNIMPGREDDEVAKKGIRLQNVQALIHAYIHKKKSFAKESSTAKEGSHSLNDEYAVGSFARIRYRGRDRTGIVVVVSGAKRTIQLREGNGDIVKPNPEVSLCDISPIQFPVGSRVKYSIDTIEYVGYVKHENISARMVEIEDKEGNITLHEVHENKLSLISGNERRQHTNVVQEHRTDENGGASVVQCDTGSTEESITCSESSSIGIYDNHEEKKRMDNFVTGRDDGGGRIKINPQATTVVTDIMSGISSKRHDEATRIVMERKKEQNPEDFWSMIHLIVADQEFAPSMYRQLFSSLHTDKRLPYILGLAMGHVHKNLVTSMFKFYQVIFDEVFKAQGTTPGSTEYNRILSGTNIRVTLKWMIMAIETFRVSQAMAYLDECGSRKLESGDGSTPLDIIKKLLSTQSLCKMAKNRDGGSDVCLGIDARPSPIPVSEYAFKLADDFEDWVVKKAHGGKKPSIIVGPSGFVSGEDVEKAKIESLQKDIEIEFTKEKVEDEYKHIWNIDYRDSVDGDEGLYTRCSRANILVNVERKTAAVLAAKYYLFRKYTAENNNDEAIGRSKARAWSPKNEAARYTPTEKNASLTSIMCSRLLFGSECYALLRGYLLTRWRPPNSHLLPSNKKCKNCGKKGRKCVCSSNHEWIVVLKATMHSCFTRNQMHYQKLLLNQLIHISCIMRHPVEDVRHLALQRIYLCWVVTEKGDPFLTEPADLVQELRLVAMTKHNARKVKHDAASLTARVTINSFVCVKQIEAAAEAYTIQNSSTERNRKKMLRESELFKSSLLFWIGYVQLLSEAEHDNKITNIVGTTSSFRSKGQLFRRDTDSAFYMELSAIEFLKANATGIEISLPTRINLAPRRLHKENDISGNKRKRNHQDSEKKAMATSRTNFVRQFVKQQPSYIPIQAHDNNMFKDMKHCGDGKATIFPTIMKLLKRNIPYTKNDYRLGSTIDMPGKPVYFKRDDHEADYHIASRKEQRGGPVFQLVDAMKDLQIAPVRRLQGKYSYTLKELARDTIYKWKRKYCLKHVDVVIIMMDVDMTCSNLRKIQRAKRKKDQNIPSNFNSVQRGRNADDLLTAFGDFGENMSKEKSTFIPEYAKEIVNQLKSEDIKEEDWEPSKLFADCTFGFLGGSDDCCAFVGSERAFPISSTVSTTRSAIEDDLKCVLKQGEGERMIFSVMHRIIMTAFDKCSIDKENIMDACFELHSEDCDVVTTAIFFVRSLHYARNHAGRKFEGSIIIRGRNKSAASLIKLDQSFVDDCKIDMNQQPTGNGWVLQIDPIALYYNLEDSHKLGNIVSGHRAMAAVTVPYFFMNCDYLPPLNGLNYSNFLDAISSKEFVTAVGISDEESCSPILLHPQSFDKSDIDNKKRSSLNLSGMILIFTIMMMQRKKTNTQLKKRYTGSSYYDIISNEGESLYDLICAASLYAGETYPVPTPIALLSRIAASNFVLQQMIFNVYEEVITPAVDRNELDSTPFIIPYDFKLGRDECRIDYSLLSISSPKNKKIACNGFSQNFRELLVRNLYGSIFDTNQLQKPTNQIRIWTFCAKNETLKAMMNGGISPNIKVDGNKLVPKLEAHSSAELTSLISHFNKQDTDGKIDCHCISGLKDVFTQALTSRTVFNIRGCGRPLLETNSVAAVSRNNGQWEEPSSWIDHCETMKDKKVEDIYAMFGTADHNKALAIMTTVSIHAYTKSQQNPSMIMVEENEILNDNSDDVVERCLDDESCSTIDLVSEEDFGLPLEDYDEVNSACIEIISEGIDDL